MKRDRLDEIENLANYALSRGWVSPKERLAEAVPELVRELRRVWHENDRLRNKLGVD